MGIPPSEAASESFQLIFCPDTDLGQAQDLSLRSPLIPRVAPSLLFFVPSLRMSALHTIKSYLERIDDSSMRA